MTRKSTHFPMRACRSRRSVLLGGAAACAGLAACTTGATGPALPVTRDRPLPEPRANPPGFTTWLAGFRARAAARGLPPALVTRAMASAAYLPDVIERDRSQFQTRRTLEDYVAIATSDERIQGGRAALRRYRATLQAIADRYGVEPHVVTAIWGVESRYGARRGDYPVLSALATLGYGSRRAAFFEGQLIAALRIVAAGDVTPARMMGSWAGAMGHTQFIPTTFLAYAVDHDGDGRRDIWADDPGDALASAANYLRRSGWRSGEPWGREVIAPTGLAAPARARGAPARTESAWAALGVRPADGGRLAGNRSARLIRPAGAAGPALLIYRNFTVLSRYNGSDKYVIAVGHLSDRLAGGGPFRAGFGPDANGLTLAERKRLQDRLKALGHDIGTTDGVLGPRTETAIMDYQRRHGLPVTGKPSRALLARLD